MSKQTLLIVVAVSLIFISCPKRPELVSSGPDEDVVRREHYFWDQSSRKWVPTIICYPAGGKAGACPLVELNPGFLDTSFGLEYLARELATRGYYAVVVDPDDMINIFPQQNNKLLQIRWLETYLELKQLERQLWWTGYDPETETALELLAWFYGELDGGITDPEVLALCRQAFDYRLHNAEAVITECLRGHKWLPGRYLINREAGAVVVGHSLGGFTALELAGAGDHSQLAAGTVRGAIVMAPATGFFTPTDIAGVEVPTLWLIAGLDKPAINTPAEALYPYCTGPITVRKFTWFKHEDFSDTFRVIMGSKEVSFTRQEKVVQEVMNFLREE